FGFPAPLRLFPPRRSSDLPAPHSAVVSSSLMRVLVVLLVIAIALLAFAQPCTESLATLFERVSPAVVSIQATHARRASRATRYRDRKSTRLNSSHVAISYA